MIRIIQTQKGSEDTFRELPALDFTGARAKERLQVDSSKRYQQHLGFGGAFTEAACYVMSGSKHKNRVIRDYYSPEGLCYNLGRVHISSSDFALGPYAYIPENADTLEAFDISHEEKWVIPCLKQAFLEAGSIRLMASPWSAPPWFKTNGKVNEGGRLLPEYRALWAAYMAKYVAELQKRGIPMEYITIQNEPQAIQRWDSMLYTAEEEAEFVPYLYTALQKEGLDTKILIWDHNRDFIIPRTAATLQDPRIRDMVWGVAYHWYASNESENVAKAHANFPEKHFVMTECCVELTHSSIGASKESLYIGNWEHGECYGRNIINDFNNDSEGWIDWNLVLNGRGGPNWVGNYCEAPIMIDADDRVLYNSSYYYIGHFSKFIRPGARRIHSKLEAGEKLYSVSYVNPDGGIVTVIQNEAEEESVLSYCLDGKMAELHLPPRSISTLLVDE